MSCSYFYNEYKKQKFPHKLFSTKGTIHPLAFLPISKNGMNILSGNKKMCQFSKELTHLYHIYTVSTKRNNFYVFEYALQMQ